MVGTFISYNLSDDKTVSKIIEWLRKRNVNVKGKQSADESAISMVKCTVFIGCVSKAYEQNESCIREFCYACENNKKIIPLMLEEFNPQGRLALNMKNIVWWPLTKERLEIRFNKVMQRILDIIQQDPAVVKNTLAQKNDEFVDVKKEIKDFMKKPLRDLNYIFGLRKFLDANGKVNELAKLYPLNEEELQRIAQADHGGGNPATTFLSLLEVRKALMPMQTLAVAFLELEIYNGLEILQRYKIENAKIGDISMMDWRELAVVLSPFSKNENNWENVAIHFDLENVIPTCKASSRQQNCYSRTEVLLQIMLMRWPEHTIADFVENLTKCGFSDIVDVVLERVEHIVSKKLNSS